MDVRAELLVDYVGIEASNYKMKNTSIRCFSLNLGPK